MDLILSKVVICYLMSSYLKREKSSLQRSRGDLTLYFQIQIPVERVYEVLMLTAFS